MRFSEYITEKYKAWREDKIGNKGSIARYAREVLEVTPQLLSEWMNRGKVPTDYQYIKKLTAVFKDDIEELSKALSSQERKVILSMNQLPFILQSPLEEALAELELAYKKEGITDSNSPRAIKLSIEILARHGFSITSTIETSDTN